MNVKDEKILTIMVEVTFLMLEKLMVMKLNFRLASKMKDLEDGGEAAEGSDEEGGEVDCCVVCGLHRGVFKEDTGRELHHYLSHGFNILKEFDILKPDDSIFLICNICNSPFPRLSLVTTLVTTPGTKESFPFSENATLIFGSILWESTPTGLLIFSEKCETMINTP